MEDTSDELTVYRRGLSIRESAKACVGRFLPGAVLGLGAVAGMIGLPGPGGWIEAVGMMLIGVSLLTVGFAAGIGGLRRWLYPDAKVTGRRSFIAGLLAPIVVFVVGALLGSGVSIPGMVALLFVAPLLLALLMFFAWLTPTPEDLRDDEYLDPDELSGRLIRSWPVERRES